MLTKGVFILLQTKILIAVIPLILITPVEAGDAITQQRTERNIVQNLHNRIFETKDQVKPFPRGNKEPQETKKPKLMPTTAKVVKMQSVSSVKPTEAIKYGMRRNKEVFGESHWNALYQLWMRESRWNPRAQNKSSGACGIPQFLPCRSYGWNHEPQIDAGLKYIEHRYGNPSKAWNHFLAKGWY